MTVYLDIVFLENVIMNYIIIFASCVVVKAEVKHWKILVSSSIGAIYTIVMYLNIIPIYSNFFMKLLLSFVMVYISFLPKSWKKLLKNLLIFYLVSFVFGGCVFALMYFVSPQLALIKNGVFVGAYPIKIALIGGLISFVIIQISFKIVKTKLSKKDMIYDIEIIINKKGIKVRALLDTGNLLKDPITGIPVIVVEHKSLYSVLPTEILNNINRIIGGDTNELTQNNECNQIISRFRIIPFSSIGKQNGLLLGIRADYINIILDEKIENINNVIVGIYDKSFTKNGMYSAIFGLDILEGGKLNECIENVKV